MQGVPEDAGIEPSGGLFGPFGGFFGFGTSRLQSNNKISRDTANNNHTTATNDFQVSKKVECLPLKI